MSFIFLYDVTSQSIALSGIFTYFAQSNGIGKLIVLLLLLSSFLGWTVMVGKHLDLKNLRSLNKGLERKLLSLKNVLTVESSKLHSSSSPYAILLKDALGAFSKHNHGLQSKDDVSIPMGHVENALARGVAKQSIRYESRMVVLGSIVTAAPFMGLLGTVWGVMDAFGSLTGQSSATIQSLAPGVSGALLTTVAGLLVAIPSVIGYNFLLSQTKLCITELENFASSLADRLELEMFERVAAKQAELEAERKAALAEDRLTEEYQAEVEEPTASPHSNLSSSPAQTHLEINDSYKDEEDSDEEGSTDHRSIY